MQAQQQARPFPRFLLRRRLRRWLAAIGQALVILLPLLLILPHSLGLLHYDLVERLDQRFHDQRMVLFAPQPAFDDRIVIVDIDEASLRHLGRWPWGRETIAQLATELLHRQQVAVLGFDVLFGEPETSRSLGRIKQWLRDHEAGHVISETSLRALERELDSDHQLTEAIKGKPVVLGYYIATGAAPVNAGQAPTPLQQPNGSALHFPQVPVMTGYTAALFRFATAAGGEGFINAQVDSDGVLRRVPLIMQQQTGAGSNYYPALSLQIFMQLLQARQVRLQAVDESSSADARKLAGVQVLQGQVSLLLPTDIHGAMLVPFRGTGGAQNGQYRYLSAKDVLAGALAPATLAGKIVLVGTSAPGLRDLRATPFIEVFPGVEVHASLLSAMLDGKFIYQPDYAQGYSLMMVLLAVLVLMLVLRRTGTLGALLWSLGLAAALTALSLWLYASVGMALPVAAMLLTVLLTYVLHTSYGYLVERRTRRRLMTLFGYYVPAELVARMAQSPEDHTAAAQSLEMTVMFCDVRNFTGLSETLEPQQLQMLLNQLFNRMADVIAPCHGTIDKYIGDCVMVFWGAPLPDTRHALHGVQTAVRLQAMMQDFNAEQRQTGQPELQIGIGINSGLMSVGDMGSKMRRSYTVIGDAVNLAARLEHAAKHYALGVVAGARTAELAPEFAWQWADNTHIPGKQQTVDIYTPLGEHPLPLALQQELDYWQQFCHALQAQHLHESLRWLDKLQALRPGKRLYMLYRERIQTHSTATPTPTPKA